MELAGDIYRVITAHLERPTFKTGSLHESTENATNPLAEEVESNSR